MFLALGQLGTQVVHLRELLPHLLEERVDLAPRGLGPRLETLLDVIHQFDDAIESGPLRSVGGGRTGRVGFLELFPAVELGGPFGLRRRKGLFGRGDFPLGANGQVLEGPDLGTRPAKLGQGLVVGRRDTGAWSAIGRNRPGGKLGGRRQAGGDEEPDDRPAECKTATKHDRAPEAWQGPRDPRGPQSAWHTTTPKSIEPSPTESVPLIRVETGLR